MDDRQERLRAFEILLDGSRDAVERTVEIGSLRRVCARGIPSHPPHLRAQAWDLLLGVMPREKERWRAERRNLRARYYDLVRREMQALRSEDEPDNPLSRSDKALLSLSNDVRTTLSAQRTLWERAEGHGPLNPPAPVGQDEEDQESSSSEEERSEDAARRGDTLDGETPGEVASADQDKTRRRPRYERVQDRRAVFDRVDAIIRAQRAAEREGERRFTAREKGKGRADDNAGSLQAELSPAIVLSPSDGEGVRRPTREERRADKAGSGGLTVRTPRLAVVADSGGGTDGSTASSPITLVSPHEIAPRKVDADAGDTHADRIFRLLYVFSRNGLPPSEDGSSSRLPPGIAHLAALLYSEHAHELRSDPHAEADAYWAFVGVMGEVGGVVLGEGGNASGQEAEEELVQRTLRRLDGRVRWADDVLWRGLALRSLQPSLGHYAYRWVVLLFSGDLPYRACLPLWDFVLSEPDEDDRIDAILDICTAMLLLVKPRLLARRSGSRGGAGRKSMWGDEDAETTVLASLTEEEIQDATMRGVALLRAYPIASVGVHEVLRVAWEIRQQRLLAAADGDGPDDIVWPADDVPVETSQAMARIGEAASAAAGAISSRVGAPNVDIAKYTAAVQESDAAAALAKASSNLTAAALAQWQSLQTQQVPAAPSWLKGGMGSLWKRAEQTKTDDKPTAPAPPPSDLSLRLAALTLPKDAPGAELYRRDTNMPPTFISPSGTIVYPQGRYRRNRATESKPATTMGSRLSALVESVTGGPTSPPSGAKPLLLSGSARPASPYSPASNASGTPGRHRSPSSTASLDVDQGVSRKISISRGKRASADATATPTQTASARLRNATRGGRPRAGSQPGLDIGSESEGAHVRFALRDPGTGAVAAPAESPADSGSESGPGRYRLVDSPIDVPEPIEESKAESPVKKGVIARRQVVKRGGRPRPPDIRSSRDDGLERQSSASTVDSRHDSLPRSRAPAATASDSLVDITTSRTPVTADFGDKSAATPRPATGSLPRSPRMLGSSPRKHTPSTDKFSRPSSLASYLTSDGEVADAESNDESDGYYQRVAGQTEADDGYGDVLEAYGKISQGLS